MANNKFQAKDMMARCVPMCSLQFVLSDKWKIWILWYVTFYRVQRFGELMRRLEGLTRYDAGRTDWIPCRRCL